MACLVAVALIAAGAVGCTTDPSPPASVTLTVHVGLFGGPGPGVRNEGDASAPIVVSAATGAAQRRRTDANGLARFSVTPGRYTVVSPTCGDGPHQVTVHAGRATHVQIRCDVP